MDVGKMAQDLLGLLFPATLRREERCTRLSLTRSLFGGLHLLQGVGRVNASFGQDCQGPCPGKHAFIVSCRAMARSGLSIVSFGVPEVMTVVTRRISRPAFDP